ncbi:MAG: hypothetical protein NTY22_09190 [Proteobacteria bacterium]|nr:hypothetical protein [Pseudomonadota bacterium]
MMKKLIIIIIPLMFLTSAFADNLPLSEDIAGLQNEEKAMGVPSNPASNDETYNFIENVSKIVKGLETQDKNTSEQIDNLKRNILSEIPCPDKGINIYKEINVYTIDIVAQKINGNASSKFYVLRDILNPHLTKRKNEIASVVFYDTSNRSLREYFTKISYSILHGDMLKKGDPRIQKVSYDYSLSVGYSIKDDKVFLSGDNSELRSIENFKKVIGENGGKLNKIEALNKLETLRKAIVKLAGNGNEYKTENKTESTTTEQN